MSELKIQQPLSRGFLIDDYRIEKLLGGGGFSYVYLAYHVRTKAKMVIKEYFAHDLVERVPGGRVKAKSEKTGATFQIGLKRFFSEGMALSQLKHPHIVNVSNFFRYNDTVYMAMDFEEGRDLRWFIKKSKGRLSEKFMLSVFPPVMEGLRLLHENNFLHLDIKPANILLRASGVPLLIDFGAVQQVQPGTRYHGVQTLTHGYAPPEQYSEGVMGPWSDIYALGMTMHICISGKHPPSSLDRLEKDSVARLTKAYGRKYSKPLLQAVDWAVELDHEKRPAHVDALLETMTGGRPVDELLEQIREPRRWFGG